MKAIYNFFEDKTSYLASVSLLLARLTLAYGFYEPAMKKWANIGAVASWFGSLGIPFPTINAYMAATTEILGVVLLSFGFLTRLISIPLTVVMLVAIFTVHFEHGFSAANNGFEIPFYFLLFLLLFISHGAGKFSIDNFLFKR
ncbi:MAG: DoxX family protein [Sulfurospirillum sp.]|nr:DoxX family protein [Sulfurospirillum sp.]